MCLVLLCVSGGTGFAWATESSGLVLADNASPAGEVKLDWRRILRYGPVSGEISFVVEEDWVVRDFPSLKTCDIKITIVDPQGWSKVVNCDFQGQVDRGTVGEKVFRAGCYVIPFCLLKDHGNDFIFAKAGRYELEFQLSDRIPVPSVNVSVEVVDCDECDPANYLDFFGRSQFLVPFSFNLKPYAEADQLGPYQEPLDIVAAYDSDKARPVLMAASWGTIDLASFTADDLAQLAAAVARGEVYADRSRCNRDFWQFMLRRVGQIRVAMERGDESVAYTDSVYFLVGD